MSAHTVSRRDFVVVLTATGGGLLLGCRVGDRSGTAHAAAAAPPPAFAPNAFIRIGTDGRVTLVMNQVEMGQGAYRSEEHTSELQSQSNLVCRLLLEKKNNTT